MPALLPLFRAFMRTAAAWRWFALPIEREPLPGRQAWFDRLAARPAFGKLVMTPLTT